MTINIKAEGSRPGTKSDSNPYGIDKFETSILVHHGAPGTFNVNPYAPGNLVITEAEGIRLALYLLGAPADSAVVKYEDGTIGIGMLRTETQLHLPTPQPATRTATDVESGEPVETGVELNDPSE